MKSVIIALFAVIILHSNQVFAAVEGPHSVSEPWSGWWWPFHNDINPNLYDMSGTWQPMYRYDQYFNQGTMATTWERNNHRPTIDWEGHCHAWSHMCYVETRPWADRPPFNRGDLEGLLTECYYNIWIDGAYPYGIWDMKPAEFWEALRRRIRSGHGRLVMDFHNSGAGPDEIYYYPVFWYRVRYHLRHGSTYQCTIDVKRVEYVSPGGSQRSTTHTYVCTLRMSGGNPVAYSGAWINSPRGPEYACYRTSHSQGNPHISYQNIRDIRDGRLIIIDDPTARHGSGWNHVTTSGYQGDYFWTNNRKTTRTAHAHWTPNLPSSGNWTISVWIPSASNKTTRATYRIFRGGSNIGNVNINQSSSTNWVTLGTYHLHSGTGNYLYLDNVTGENDNTRIVVYDAVRFSRSSAYGGGPQEEVILTTPKAGVLSLTNAPNPFKTRTEISYIVPGAEVKYTSLKIYNAIGQVVRTLVDGNQIGSHSVSWNAKDDFGRKVPCGVYIAKLRVGDLTKTTRMILVK